MVRFHWPCDGGQNSFVPPGGVDQDTENGVTHVNCEMELSGQNETCPALFTVPSTYLEDGTVQPVGLILGHGADAEQARGPFFTSLAVHFAKQGHVVMRYLCKQKEQRRQRIYERTADTAATSPYARTVSKWIYVGHENGARIAALVGYKSPRPKAGFVFLSYPLLEPMPPPPKQKVGAEPPADSIAPLLKLAEASKAPQLYINGELDWNCPGADLKALAPTLEAAGIDARAVILPDLDAKFRKAGGAAPDPAAVAAITSLLEAFIRAVGEGSMASFDAPKVAAIVPSTRVPPRPAADPEAAGEEGEGEEEEEGGGPEAMEGVAGGVAAAPQVAMAPRAQVLQGVSTGMGDMSALHAAQLQQQAAMQAHMRMAMQQQQAAAAAAAAAGGAGAAGRPQVLQPHPPGNPQQ